LAGIKREDLDRIGVTYGPNVRIWFRRGTRARCELLEAAERALDILGHEFIPWYKRAIYRYEERTHSRVRDIIYLNFRVHYVRKTEKLMEDQSYEIRQVAKEGWRIPT